MDKISLIFIFQAAGLVMGALFGLLTKHLNRQLMLTALLTMMSVASLLIPWSQRLSHLYLYNGIFGMGAGAWINAKNVWTIELWQHRSAPVLQLSALMFGVGSILGPLIDDPYLIGHIKQLTVIDNTPIDGLTGAVGNDSAGSFDVNVTVIEDQRLHNVRSPFVICAIIQIIGPILLIIMYFLRKYEKGGDKYMEIEDRADIERKATIARIPYLKFSIIALVSLFLAFHMSSEQNTQQFSATFFQDIQMKLTASKSAEVVSAMAVANTVGLAVSVLVSAVGVRPQYMITYHLLFIFAGLNILFLDETSELLLYVGSLLLSYGFSAVYPAVFALASRYIDVTDTIGTVFMVSSVVLNLFLPFVIGLYIEVYVYVLLVSIAANLAITVIVFIFLQQLINKYCK
ncbi:unnamed protein product [Medioppia subpectinata]|uniref:Uncharacterized protein n=1 Tax=Medioppia subpectinata TaxID=1979941 RepID=A0A7R9L3X1_9ACAR|nr:unnamed protein product [Medioppia subpectinata]CAG2115099.1 unnamed protein product [Medioppia subpectinata]